MTGAGGIGGSAPAMRRSPDLAGDVGQLRRCPLVRPLDAGVFRGSGEPRAFACLRSVLLGRGAHPPNLGLLMASEYGSPQSAQ